MKITKAVIPVAGKGTRFLPATKQVPKEMIPIIKKPMIHYAVEEAVLSGIEQVIFVTSSGKETIENYFDRNLELEGFLNKNDKEEMAELIKRIGSMIDITTVRQKEQLGLGHAINCARNLIGDERFAVILGDDLVLDDNPVTKQLMAISDANNQSPVIGVMKVAQSETNKYGIIDGVPLGADAKTYLMKKMIEKPEPSKAPTNLATPGRYILNSQIFKYLEKIPRGVGGEYQLTDAINMMAVEEEVFAHIFQGDRFDTGSIQGYLEATIEFALRDNELSTYMKGLLKAKVEKYEIR
jgi:UTP--glucose-1-phosphate uridylyltransferase